MKVTVAEFELYVDFEKESTDPQRVFRAVQRLLDVLAEMDELIAKALDPRMRTELLLEDITFGSMRAFIRTVLEWIPDEGLKDLDWKKIVGGVLVRVKHLLLKKLQDHPGGFTKADQLRNLQTEIDAELRASGLNQLNAYGTLHRGILADLISDTTKAQRGLHEGDRVEFRSQAGVVRFNPTFNTDNLSELASEGFETVRQKAMLKVKKIDLLGESRWTFRLNDKRTIEARITDQAWLHQLHNREVSVISGDWLETELETGYLHGAQQTHVQVQHTITHVYRVFNPDTPDATQQRLL